MRLSSNPRPLLTVSPFLAELLGTAILILLGNGVVANVVLQRTKGQNSGWIVIAAGWALAVTVAVYAVNSFSGAHLNPAVTVGLAAIGKFPWAQVPLYVAAQMIGAFVGGWLHLSESWVIGYAGFFAGTLVYFATRDMIPGARQAGTARSAFATVAGGAVLMWALSAAGV